MGNSNDVLVKMRGVKTYFPIKKGVFKRHTGYVKAARWHRHRHIPRRNNRPRGRIPAALAGFESEDELNLYIHHP
ncbi:hypothetical protein MASR2M78_13110 [Treponema sp.]